MSDQQSAPRSPNTEMAAMQRQLIALATTIELAIDDAPDAASVHKLNEQFAALNWRITATGRQLFAAQSAELSIAAHDITHAIPQVERALGDLARVDSVVAGINSVLTLVDTAIGIAKKAA